jgi:tetratricopeptide (TPR) repeat protein
MLHLIIPPIIVIASLGLLVYIFSRRFLELQNVMKRGEMLRGEPSVSTGVRPRSVKRLFVRLGGGLVAGLGAVVSKPQALFRNWRQSLESKKDLKSRTERSFREAHVKEEPILTVGEAVIPDRDDAETLFTRSSRKASGAGDAPVIEEVKVPESSLDVAPPSPRRRRMVRMSRSGKSSEETSVRPTISRRAARLQREVTTPEKSQLEEILIERIAANPRDIEAYERLGDYYMEQENLQDAKECYRQVLRLSPVHRLAKIKVRKLEKALEKRANI